MPRALHARRNKSTSVGNARRQSTCIPGRERGPLLGAFVVCARPLKGISGP